LEEDKIADREEAIKNHPAHALKGYLEEIDEVKEA